MTTRRGKHLEASDGLRLGWLYVQRTDHREAMRLLLLLLVQTSILFTTGSGRLIVHIGSVGPIVKSGDNVTLNCSVVAGGPADSISWYDIADVNTKLKLSKGSVTWDSLVFPNVTLKDATTYRCQAVKGTQTDYHEYTLDVYAKPVVQLSPLRITKPHDSVREDCTATGFPKPNITWYLNSEVLKAGALWNSVHLTPIESSKTTTISSLALLGIDDSHYGNFTCEATNEMGSSKKTLRLLLKREPKVIAGGVQIIRENGNATLACEGQQLIHEDSHVDFSWDFEGKQIPKDNAHYKQSTNRVAGQVVHMELAVLRASINDSGLYDCHVENSLKRSSGEVRLVVISKDVKPKARIAGPSQRAVKLGSNVTLQCAISYPAYLKTVNMSWSNSSAKYNITEKNVDDLTSRSFILLLNLVNITRQDLGSYTCEMNTSIGGSVSQVRVMLLQVTGTVEVTRQDSSGNSLVMLALIVTAGVVSGLSGALWVLKHWRKKKNLPYLGPINNEEFKYDVFITFSGKDFAWVKAKLIPLLEKHGVDYCIHNRDFELGKAILDNMADSVYRSKKVLAVMSRNYMDSKYCRGELEMALYRSTEMGDSSVIVIRIDGIEKERLPKALRNRTFLDYYDETERKTWAERIMKHLNKEV